MGKEVSMFSMLSPHTKVECGTPFWYYEGKHLIFSTMNFTEGGFSPELVNSFYMFSQQWPTPISAVFRHFLDHVNFSICFNITGETLSPQSALVTVLD